MRLLRAFAATLAGALLLTSCGDENATSEAAGDSARLTPVLAEQILVADAEGRLLVLNETGAVVRTLGALPAEEGAEVDAIDVSPDGTRALVSVLNDHDEACSASVFEVTESGPRRLFDGAAAAFSPDGRRIVHLGYTERDEFCFRSTLTIRDADAGTVLSTSPLPGGETMEDTPPSWPLNFSPDGDTVVFLGAKGEHNLAARTVEITPDGSLGASQELAGGRFFSPAYLAGDVLVGADDCCIRQKLVSRDQSTGRNQELAPLPAPVRSIRADRGGRGAWLVLEEAELFRWDGGALTQVPVEGATVLIASG